MSTSSDGSGNLTRQEVFRTSAGNRKLVTSTDRFFDYDGRLYAAYTRNSRGKLLSSLQYTYDENGNPTRKQTESSDQQYAYDVLNRITEVGYANQTDTYTYNAVGERTSKNGEPYIYNARGELLSSPGDVTYAYDPQGRRTAKHTPAGTETYAYNSLDQLTAQTTKSGKSYTYAFDALGRMTSANEAGFTRTYNYGASDSPTSIQTSLTGAAGSQLRREEFSYGPGGLIETRMNDQAPKYPTADRLGTLTGEVSDGGEASVLPELDPFGVPTGEAQELPAIDQRTLGFLGGAGREALPDSQLVKMGARMYDAETGAFVTRDPVTGEPSEPARRVAYAYAFNGPGRYVDLDGRSVIDDAIDAAGSAVKAIGSAHEAVNESIENSQNPIVKTFVDVTRKLETAIKCSGVERFLDLTMPVGRVAKAGKVAVDAAKAARGVQNAKRLTNSQARDLANYLGFHSTGQKTQHGELIFRSGKRYISADRTGHGGGVWKMAKSPSALDSRTARMGTYDEHLNRIGP